MKDELSQGFNMDLSKTFDSDEDFNKVAHNCIAKGNAGVYPVTHFLPIGTRCPHCGEVVRAHD